MRILLALDKFKGSMSAGVAVDAAAAALRASRPDWTLDLCPLTDGGDGFAEILTHVARGSLHQAKVSGPLGRPVNASYGLVAASKLPGAARSILLPSTPASQGGSIAIVEMATASGLALLAGGKLDPWHASSRGTGELMLAAQRQGAQLILLGVGGSATHDLGLGALEIIGLKFQAKDGSVVSPPFPARWDKIVGIQCPADLRLPPIRIACDVSNPLLGPNGAARVYARQKGFAEAELAPLDDATGRMAKLLFASCGQPESFIQQPGAGAAGGIAFGLMTALNAQLLSGNDLVSAWFDLDQRIARADVIITGEGAFDESSLSGKGPGALTLRALRLGKPVHVFAGRVVPIPRCDRRLHLHAITPAGMPLPEALRAAPRLLTQAVRNTF